MVEKLRYEDSFVNEIIVSVINATIDELVRVDEDMAARLDRHWKYHRKKNDELEERLSRIESKLGLHREKSDGNDKKVPGDRTDEKPQDDKR